MKVVVIGGKGTIGSAVVNALKGRHEIIIVGRKSGDVVCDMTAEDSILRLFEQVKEVDAVVVTAGNIHFEPFTHMTTEKYFVGLNDKLMGQVKLVMIGSRFLKEGGSFTLTSGILNRDPIRTGSSAAMVNGAIDGFVKGVAVELPHKLRINAVSPTVLQESMGAYGAYFRGYEPAPAARVALAYCKSVEGAQTGQVYTVG